MDDYFCPSNAPEALKRAARDLTAFRQYLKSITDQELSQALELIHMQHGVHRSIIKEEMEARQQVEAKSRGEKSIAQAERHHSDRQWWTRFAAWVAFSSAVVGLVSFLAGRFLPPPQDRELARRVTALEHQLSAAPPNPRVTTTLPTTTPPQIQSPSTSLPTPSVAPTSTPAPQATPPSKQP